MTVYLACHRCDWQGALALRQACPACEATLRVVHDGAPPTWAAGERGVWRYRARLPIAEGVAPVTLGEGGTPLLELGAIDGVRALAKVEAVNPTLSFKDRPVSVAATAARELGAAGLLCASTGNTAVAVAAYAARAGLPAVCVVPDGTPPAKLALAVAAGAAVLPVRGSYSDAHALAGTLAAESGWANLSSTYLNPFMLEGDKTVAFEL
ncbi:MAG TPA: pyridoxal-phosphate dependent enzyme, partial [Capillimicrobium sp.]|nr:pyridoxal-phosphate dependent enzyme [Capillimicrobium sp.]